MTNDQASLTQTKAGILKQIAAGRAEFEALIGKLSDAQLTAASKDGWRIQDHLIHIGAWELGIVALLRHEPRYRAMGVDATLLASGNFDAMNDAICRQHKDKTLAQARAYFRDAHREILDAINALSDADLLKPYSHYQSDEPREDNGDPILRWIGGNTYGHYAEHSEWIEAMLA